MGALEVLASEHRVQVDALLEKNAQLRKTIHMLLGLLPKDSDKFRNIHAHTHAVACLSGVTYAECVWCDPPPSEPKIKAVTIETDIPNLQLPIGVM